MNVMFFFCTSRRLTEPVQYIKRRVMRVRLSVQKMQRHFVLMCLCCCHQCLTINQRPSGRGVAQLVAPCVITKLTFKQRRPYFTLCWMHSGPQIEKKFFKKRHKGQRKESIRDRMHSNVMLMDPRINNSAMAILLAH